MKSIDITSSDFKYLIEEDCLFIDKSLFIENVLDDKNKIKLFLRPRRFGKSLNLSMLYYFFSIEGATENKELFKGLKIEQSPYFSEMGKYPVIYLDMKDLGNTYEKLERNLNNKIHRLFVNFNKVLEGDLLSIDEKNDYIKIKDSDAIDIPLALDVLCSSISKFYGQQVIVLIDEYDAPLVKAYKHGYYNEAVELLSQFYGVLLKNNTYTRLAVIVGVLRLSQTGIYSGLNNLYEYNILTPSFEEYFGFTEDEVVSLLKTYKLEHNLDDIKAYYDGYKFGDVHIYNPWSISKYLTLRELEPHWIKTAENYLIKELLDKADDEIVTQLDLLLKRKAIKVSIAPTSSLSNNLSKQDIWSQLFYAGYLTLDDKQNKSSKNKPKKVRIPNKEIYDDFINIVTEHIFNEVSNLSDLLNAMLANDFDKFKNIFLNILDKHVSYKDMQEKESFYKIFMLVITLLLNERRYLSKSEGESGKGLFDLMIQPKNTKDRGFLFEFKHAKSKNTLDNLAKNAILQIESHRYCATLESFRIKRVTIVGIAFHKKLLSLITKNLILNDDGVYVEEKKES